MLSGVGLQNHPKVSIVAGGRFHAFDLARELASRSMLARLVTTYPKFKTRQFGITNDLVSSIPTIYLQRGVQELSSRLSERANSYLDLGFATYAATRLQGCNIVHGWSGYSLPSFRWASRHGVKTVVERGSAHLLTQMEILGREFEHLGIAWRPVPEVFLERELEEYASADMISVPSLFVQRSFAARGFDPQKIVVSPFGVDLSAFSPGPKADSVFRVVYAGVLSVQKGLHYLRRAFELARIKSSELLLVGGANHETEQLLGGISDAIRAVGRVPQSELVQHYRRGSVFAIASVQEGLAMVQAQAMASGLPLVCTTNTGGEDLLRMSGALMTVHEGRIQEYPAGYVVPIRDPEAMAYCFQTLASDPELLESKRQAALATRGAGLNWDRYTTRLVEGYRQVLSASR